MGIGKDFREPFSKNLMIKFLEKDITQKKLSDLTGIPSHRIYTYLHGEVMPKKDYIDKIAKVLDTTFDDLINF